MGRDLVTLVRKIIMLVDKAYCKDPFFLQTSLTDWKGKGGVIKKKEFCAKFSMTIAMMRMIKRIVTRVNGWRV